MQPVDSVPDGLMIITGLVRPERRQPPRLQNWQQHPWQRRLRRDEIDTARSLDPYIQANWAINRWTLQAGVRHSTMELDVDDQFLSNGDSSGNKTIREHTVRERDAYALHARPARLRQCRQRVRDASRRNWRTRRAASGGSTSA